MGNHNMPGFTNLNVRQLMVSLMQISPGTHSILVYPSLKTMREIFTEYINLNCLQSKELFVILPYYQTIESVKNNLLSDSGSTKNYEKMRHEGSLVIQDAYAILKHDIKSKSNFTVQTNGEIPKIFDFLNRVLSHAHKISKNSVSVWIDTGIFHNFDNGMSCS
jgi:hypothetical protein